MAPLKNKKTNNGDYICFFELPGIGHGPKPGEPNSIGNSDGIARGLAKKKQVKT
jgi:hypothetical protein